MSNGSTILRPFRAFFRYCSGPGVTITTSRTVATPLTRNQIRGFWAAWGGWALDGMDSFIYALVLTPAITELLPGSGIEARPPNVLYLSLIHI